MPRVRVVPLEVDIELEPGERLADAAWRLGYRWPTACWGQAQCMLCRVQVVSGEDQIVPPDDDELDGLRRFLPASARPAAGVRLACRLEVTGDGVTVEKVGVRPPSEAP